MKKNKGFSLLEVLVAFTILTIAMIPILSMYPMMFRMSHRAGTNEELARLSLSVIDYIKSRGYDNLKTYSVMGITKTYSFEEIEESGAYTSTDDDSNNEPDFEDDYSIPDGFFLLNSKEGNLDNVTLTITLAIDFFTLQDVSTTSAVEINYANPVSGKTNDSNFDLSIISATSPSSIVTNEFIVGTIIMEKDDDGDGTADKDYTTTFVMSPIENW